MKKYQHFSRVISSLLTAALILTVAGCGGPTVPTASTAQPSSQPSASQGSSQESTEPVTLTFVNWASVEESTSGNILSVIEEYQKQNPNVTIENQGIAVSDIVKELTIMCAAGNAPDVAQLASDNVIQMQSSGFLTAADDYLSQSFVEDLYPDLYDAVGLVEGKHYAIPWANSTHGLYYNRKLMAEAGLDPESPPRTIDEMTAMMKQAKEKLPDDVIMLQADTTVRTLGLIHQWPFMVAFNGGIEPYTLEGEVNFSTEGMAEYMEWIRMLVKDGYTLPGQKYGQFRPYAAQDKLLFGNDWSCFDGVLLSTNDKLTAEDIYETWGVTYLPAGDDGVGRTPVQAHVLSIFSGKNAQEAAKFIEFVVGDKFAIDGYTAKGGFTPSTKSAMEVSPDMKSNLSIASFVSDVVPTSVTMPTGADYNSYAEIIMTAVQEVITTDNEIGPILESGQKKLEDLFK